MNMKLTQESVVFSSLRDLNEFIRELGLIGVLRFHEPIQDTAGNILYKEDLPVKQGTLDKLLEMEGQYRERFAVKMDDDVVRAMGKFVAREVIHCLDLPDNILSKLLFDKTRHNYKSYIVNAFSSKKLIMVMYKMTHEKPDFFDYIAGLGLLCLGIVLPLSSHIRMIHRYSFLAGLCVDLGLMDTDLWKTPIEEYAMKIKAAERSAKYIEGMSVPPAVPSAIRKHVLNPLDPVPPEDEDLDVLPGSLVEGVEGGKGGDVLDVNAGGDEGLGDEALAEIVKEVLKIARFYQSVRYRCREKDDYLKQLIEKLAYNAARGYFSRKLAEPIIGRFKEYEKIARFMMRIAGVERKCLRPFSAWAYPKPKASQILCRNREFSCPNILMGRDLHVVADSEAFGWIGLNLEAGKYPKCTLEEEIMKLSREILK